jgi:GNAT superfamily N-acetyltransferase
MDPVVTSRDLRPADATAAVAAIRAGFASNAPLIDPPASASRETAENIVAWLDAGGGGAVIEAGRKIVAVVLWTERDGGLYIARLAVLPDWRGRGFARLLLVRAESEARARKLPRLHLGTRLALTNNRRLFAAAGFVEIREHAHKGYERPTWVEMEKRLG